MSVYISALSVTYSDTQPYIDSSSCMYRSSPPPPSTSWSSFRMISFSNCRKSGENKGQWQKQTRRRTEQEEINYASMKRCLFSLCMHYHTKQNVPSVCKCSSAEVLCDFFCTHTYRISTDVSSAYKHVVCVALCCLDTFLHACATLWKFPECAYSQVIMSKKMGMVALLNSSSGIKVISRMGPTMPGMKQILWLPKRQTCIIHRTCNTISDLLMPWF